MAPSIAPDRLERLVLKIESSYVLVRAVSSALAGRPFEISSLYPPGSEWLLPAFNRLPAALRNRLIHVGVAAQGHSLDAMPPVNADDVARWCVSKYPARQYPAIVVGAANGAAAHLAAFLGAPLLTTHLVFGFRNVRTRGVSARDASVLDREVEIGLEFTRRLLPADSGLEAILHYDPFHDRFLVNAMTLVRLKMTRLPGTYADFIRERLAPGGVVILNDCRYTWKAARVSGNLLLQIGGLGGISPDEFVRLYPPPPGLPVETVAESEWGTPPPFAASVRAFAASASPPLEELSYERPDDLSASVASLVAEMSGSSDLLLDCFSFTDPFTCRQYGIPPYWLPFNTSDCLDRLTEFLSAARFDTIYFSLVPALVPCPDMPPLDEWRDLLRAHSSRVVELGLSRWYPADSFAAFRFDRDLRKLRAARDLRPLTLAPADLHRPAFARVRGVK